MSVTLKNITEYTNISTVSRAFNREPRVKEETRLAVRYSDYKNVYLLCF